MISEKEVKKVAQLARLKLTKGEIKKFQKELSSILKYFEKLKELNLEQTEPTSHSIPLENVMRTDKEIKNLESEGAKLLNLMPERKNGYLKVKKII